MGSWEGPSFNRREAAARLCPGGHLGTPQAALGPGPWAALGAGALPKLGCRAPGPAPPRETRPALTPPLATPPDLLQVEVTKAYLARQADEITLQQADVVLILQREDGERAVGPGGRAGGEGGPGEAGARGLSS